jgi:hypothetical protein
MARCSKGRHALTVTLPPGVYDVRERARGRPLSAAERARAFLPAAPRQRLVPPLTRAPAPRATQYKFNVGDAWVVSADEAEGTCPKGHVNNQARGGGAERREDAALTRRPKP